MCPIVCRGNLHDGLSDPVASSYGGNADRGDRMAILTEQLEFTAKGSLSQTEDWYTLCYDTDAKEFYIEHQWDHMDPYSIGKKASDRGTARLPVDDYKGPGISKLSDAKQTLMTKASG
jgi:hypothetical protein